MSAATTSRESIMGAAEDHPSTPSQPTPEKRRRGKKPQGEFVWVRDGKTEYLAQAVEPLVVTLSQPPPPRQKPQPQEENVINNKNDGEEDEEDVIEVRWTHNGVFEWVPRSAIRVLWQEEEQPRSVSAPSNPSLLSSLLLPSAAAPPRRRVSTRTKTPTKTNHRDDNNSSHKTMMKLPPPPPSSSSATKKRKAVDEEQEEQKVNDNNEESSTNILTGEPHPPPLKKLKTDRQDNGLFHSGRTVLSTLLTHASTVQKSFLVACQEIHKELLGPSSL
jgi:hypothetical protein